MYKVHRLSRASKYICIVFIYVLFYLLSAFNYYIRLLKLSLEYLYSAFSVRHLRLAASEFVGRPEYDHLSYY